MIVGIQSGAPFASARALLAMFALGDLVFYHKQGPVLFWVGAAAAAFAAGLIGVGATVLITRGAHAD